MTLTRGEWNSNPLNINFMKPSIAWRGQLGIESVQPSHSYTPRFGRYDTDFNGIRAGAKQMIVDNQTHGLSTLRALVGDPVHGWAPAADSNDDEAYCGTVIDHLHASGFPGYTPDTHLMLSIYASSAPATILLPALWTGFCLQENGRCTYASELVVAACRDALGLPKE